MIINFGIKAYIKVFIRLFQRQEALTQRTLIINRNNKVTANNRTSIN